MQERSDKLKKQFRSLRGPKADDEADYLKSLLLVDKYVHSFDNAIPELVMNIAENPKLKEEIGEAKIRILSTMLYIKFNIDEVVDKLTGDNASEIKLTLEKLRTLMVDIYDNYADDANYRVESLFDIVDEVIKFTPKNKKDAEYLRDILPSAAALIAMFHRTLPTLGWFTKTSTKTLYGLDIDNIIPKVEIALKGIVSKVKEVDKFIQKQKAVVDVPSQPVSEPETIVKPVVVSVPTEPVNVPETIMPSELVVVNAEQVPVTEKTSEPVERTCKDLAIELLKAEAGEPLKLDKLISKLGDLYKENTSILKLKQDMAVVEKERRLLWSLHDDLLDNKELIIGRLYIQDLLNDHPNAFEVLQKLAAQDERFVKLSENLSKINNPGIAQYTVSTGLKVLSTVAALNNIIYRAIAPTMLQEAIEARAPDTLDSESKRLLEQVLTHQEGELAAKFEQIKKEIKKVPSDSTLHAFHDLLIKESADDIQKMDNFLSQMHSALENAAKIEKRSQSYLDSAGEQKLAQLPVDHPEPLSLQKEINSLCLSILNKDADKDKNLDELQNKLNTIISDLRLLAGKRKLIESKKQEIQQASDAFKKGLFDNFNIKSVTEQNSQLEALLGAAELENQAYKQALLDFESRFPTLTGLTQKQSVDEIERVADVMSVAHQSVVEVIDISQKMKEFELLNKDKIKLEAYVKANDVWTTYLWNWLVELFTKGKSETMLTMDDARALNAQIVLANAEITNGFEQAKTEMSKQFSEGQKPVDAVNPVGEQAEVEVQPKVAFVPKIQAQILLSQSRDILFKINGKAEQEVSDQNKPELKNP